MAALGALDSPPASAGRIRWSDPLLPVKGWVEVGLPLARLWEAFEDVRGWPEWNRCFWRARVTGERLAEGEELRWAFNAIRPLYPYKMPARATIVECEPERVVTWEVTALPGFHALHSYRFEQVDADRSRFGSWEVAAGPTYRAARRFWLAHFDYVCRASLEGARRLGPPPGVPAASPFAASAGV